MKNFLQFLLVLSFFTSSAQTQIFGYNSAWKYLDNGTNQGTGRTASTFDDAAWASGNGQLGYGDGDEATTLGYGPDANNKYITSYFRKSISITNPSSYSSFTANVKRDDGIVVYVNGAEVYRNNITTGTITYTTLATAAASDDGGTAQTFTINPNAFINGANVIAVEIHQNAVTSTDISFDMELLATTAPPPPTSTTLTDFAGSWKYLDNGTNQGTAWRGTSFNDASWNTGTAPLGYGTTVTTTVSFGTNAKKKYITTYFRKAISIADVSQYNNFSLNIKRDDGAIVYINGVEVYRTNMPTGAVTNTTRASSEAPNPVTIQTGTINQGSLVNGTNVIAVEIHQAAPNGADIFFDLQLKGNSGTTTMASLTRGPYLQMGNQSAVSLRWRTNAATNSQIEVGTAAGVYTLSASNPLVTTDHEVRITGLNPDTKYFYRFGSTSQILQGDNNNFFTTSPDATATRKIRIAAFGDCGRNDNGFQSGTLSSYQNFVGSNPAEVMLLLGDNAYNSGTDNEYQSNFFNTYSSNVLKNHVLFPSPGNHDYANDANRQIDHNVPYFSIFSNPSNAECGGTPSATEAYYSWDWGNIHFLSLDSYGKENGTTRLYDTTGAQVTWIKQDLAANTKKWVIAYWHHPPYTMGSHNSDNETELINIRQRFIRILERLGVDLILCGHSHDYERSYLLNGNYGNEASFTPAIHAKSISSANYNGTANSCPYITHSGESNKGTVYVVAGSAGADGGVQTGYPHNALPFSVDNGGMLYFEIENNRLDAKFLRRDGVVADQFTILKDANNVTQQSITAGSSVELTASWPGVYNWSTGETSKTITVTPTASTLYLVNDNFNCLVDSFMVDVVEPAARLRTGARTLEKAVELNWQIQPSLVRRGQQISVQTGLSKATEVLVTDGSGKLVGPYKITGKGKIDTHNLKPGVYFIRLNTSQKLKTQKFVVAN